MRRTDDVAAGQSMRDRPPDRRPGRPLALTPLGVALEERLGLGWLFRAARAAAAAGRYVSWSASSQTAPSALGLPERISAWPRTVHARLIERLRGGRRVDEIVLDVIFGQPREAGRGPGAGPGGRGRRAGGAARISV